MAGIILALCVPHAAAKSRTDRLLERLPSASGEERLHVITALGRAQPRKALEPLLDLFDIRNSGPRESTVIVRALGRLGRKRAVVPLMQSWDYLNSLRLRDELPVRLKILRAEIVSSLGEIGGSRSRPLLRQALRDSDLKVVEKACEALGRIRDRKSVPVLLELLMKGGGVRQAAFEALGEIKSSRGKGTLERALRSADPFVRVQAGYALARMGEKKGKKSLRAILDEEERFHKPGILAAHYLARLDDEIGIDYLLAVLGGPKASLKIHAAEALGKSRNGEAVEPLAGYLESDDAGLRLAVVRGLGHLGGKKAVKYLNEARFDADRSVAHGARLALAELGEYGD